MPVVCSSFRYEQIVVSISLVDMWALRDDFYIAIPENILLSHLVTCGDVDFEATDATGGCWHPGRT
jgi:hypothetical protein